MSCVELKIVLLEVFEVRNIGSSGTQLSQLNYSIFMFIGLVSSGKCDQTAKLMYSGNHSCFSSDVYILLCMKLGYRSFYEPLAFTPD